MTHVPTPAAHGPRCIEVALAVPLFRTFTYAVPEEIAVPIAPGSRVLVPFRHRQEIGICLGAVAPPDGVVLKPVQAVVDDVPSLPASLLHTGRWIAEVYDCGAVADAICCC